MNKLNPTLAILSLILFFAISSSSVNAQQWVADMQDTNLTLDQQVESFNAYWDNHEYEKGKGFKQFKRREYSHRNRLGNDGKYSTYSERISDYKQAEAEMSTKSMGAAGKWTQLGPFGPSNGGGSGRINCIDFHPTDANIIIAAAPSGGIWRSTDAGESWTTNTDDLASIGFSDIKFAPSNGNIVYAASGDIDADDTYSHGILKSTDGGITWAVTGWAQEYSYNRQTYRILVHPTNEDIVYASTSLGLYKTTDGGTNWDKIRIGIYKDIEFNPANPDIIYITTGTTVYKSSDAGVTYTSILNISGSSRINIAVTAADPNYIYLLSALSSDGGYNGVYLSTDEGANFTLKSNSPNVLGWNTTGSDSGGQGWYDLAFTVSPTDKNRIFIGGVNIWTSTDAGATMTLSGFWYETRNVPYVHADIHMLKYSPHNTSTLWACTDGGLSISTDNGTDWNEKNTGLSIAQMYRLGGSKTVEANIITGWQDNGTNLMTTTWDAVYGGDGMECIISHSDPLTMYSSIYYGGIYKSTNGGNNFTQINNSISETGAWVTPYVMDDEDDNLLFAGYVNVWKTTNGGSAWTAISSWGSSTLNALSIGGTNSSDIWAANSNQLYKTTDGGANWTEITASIGSGQVNYIAINKADPNKVWVCKSGFYDGEKVYQTNDGGINWTNISGSLPNYPVNTIINAATSTSDALYIGTDLGVYYYDTDLGDWVPFMKDLPNVIVKELEFYDEETKIRAATYGRGLWESVTYPLANSIDTDESTSIFDINIYPNPANSIVNIDFRSIIPENSKLTILNSLGGVVSASISLDKTSNQINTSNLPNGIYFIKIYNDTQQSVHKIVIN